MVTVKNINVEFTEEEFKELTECKRSGITWKEYILSSMWIQATLKRNASNLWGKKWGFTEPIEFNKPCHDTGFCPYGQIVEMFPIKRTRDQYSCAIFGHNCPAFYMAEPHAETAPTLDDKEKPR